MREVAPVTGNASIAQGWPLAEEVESSRYTATDNEDIRELGKTKSSRQAWCLSDRAQGRKVAEANLRSSVVRVS